jgi:hypothetical protein
MTSLRTIAATPSRWKNAPMARAVSCTRAVRRARALEAAQRRRRIARRAGDVAREAERVLDRLAGALRDILEHRVGGIAHQSDPAARPVEDRLAVVHRPPFVAPHQLAARLHVIAGLRVMRIELVDRAPIGGSRLIASAAEHRDLVVELAAADRVLHEMHVGADPHDDVVEPGMLRHLLGGDGAAVGDIAVAHRHVLGDALAHRRPQPVSADE